MLWIILVGLVAGIIARHLLPGPNNPSGIVLTTLLGIASAFVATYLGQQLGPAAGASSWGQQLGPAAGLVSFGSGGGLHWRPGRRRGRAFRVASPGGDPQCGDPTTRDPLGGAGSRAPVLGRWV